MTDRELLELAAKASRELTASWYGNDAYFDGVLSRWNPLTDDGDALRLAIKLQLNVNLDVIGAISVSSLKYGVTKSEESDDPCADARRAIVRAAAEIGRRMK